MLEDDCLVGSGSVVLHHAVIGSGATVGANAVVPNRMEVPAGALAVGVPAVLRPGKSNLAMIRFSAAEYVANGRRYRETSPNRLRTPETRAGSRRLRRRAPIPSRAVRWRQNLSMQGTLTFDGTTSPSDTGGDRATAGSRWLLLARP